MDNTRIIKKVLYLFVTAIFAGFIFAGSVCQANQEFIVGFDAEFPPYGYMDDNGDYTGFDLDLAEEVCKRKGWSLVKRPIKWDFKDSELDSGSISCLWNGFTMNGRESEYTWSTPYVDNSQVVITSSSSGIKKLKDLTGKILAVQADSSALAALEGENATDENKALAKSLKELQQVDDYNSAFMNLESGMVDAIAMDIGVASYQLSSKGGKFVMLDERLATEKYGIGFKSGNTELRDEVQLALLEMLDDGTFENIAKKWGLQDSVCLSIGDTTYIDGSKVPATAGDSQDNAGSYEVKKEDASSKNDNSVVKADVPEVKKLSITQIIKQLSSGLAATIAIFVLTILFSMPLGLVIAAARMSKFKIIQWIAKIYISIMRGTPLMLQLIVVFFAPFYIFEISTPYSYRFYAVIIGFSLNYAAYFAEIYRSGIQSIPQGQREAAQIMGYSRGQTFSRIIFPQMVKRVLPPVTNEVITLVKDTSLAFALSYAEMFTKAKQIAAAQTSLLPLFVAGLFYYIFNFIVAFIMERVEKRLDYYK